MHGSVPRSRLSGTEYALRLADEKGILRQEDSVLLFGSYARGDQQTGSDVDLLLVGDARPDRASYDWPRLSVDIVRQTVASLHKELLRTAPWNNHFYLNILNSGIVIRDEQGRLGEVIRKAQAMHSAGPPRMTSDQAIEARQAILTMLRSIKASRFDYASLTPEGKVLRRMRMDQVVNRAIHLSYKAQARWGNIFPKLVLQLRNDDPELHSLWSQYIHASSEEAPSVVAEIVNLCVSYLGSCSPEARKLENNGRIQGSERPMPDQNQFGS